MAKKSLKKEEKPKIWFKNKKVWFVVSGIIGFILIVLLVFGIGIFGLKWDNKSTIVAAKIFPYPVAIVNYTHWVKASEFLDDLASLKQYYNKTQNIDFSGEEGQKKLKELRKNLIDQLIEKEIITLEAKNYGVAVEQSEIDEEYNNIAKSNDGEDKVKEQIKNLYNWTVDDFKKMIKSNLLQQKLEQKIATDERINEEAKKQAADILAKAKAGDNFAKLAAQYSQDSTALRGGDLGFFSKGQMVIEFEKAAFSLKKGEIYPELVKTRYGYHIIKCTDKKGNLVRASHIIIKTKDFRTWLSDKKKEYKIWQLIKS